MNETQKYWEKRKKNTIQKPAILVIGEDGNYCIPSSIPDCVDNARFPISPQKELT